MSEVDLRWWTAPKDDAHEAVWAALRQIKRAQSSRRLNDILHLSLYGNMKAPGFNPYEWQQMPARAHARLSLNVVRNVIGAVVSKIAAKNKVKPSFLTMGGDYSMKRKAEQLEKLVQGVFYKQKLYQKQRAVFRDACIFGPGPLKIITSPSGKDLVYERTPQWELSVDDQDAFAGDPRCMYQEKWYDVAVLSALFPEHKDAIEKASKSPVDGHAYDTSQTTANIVPVVETWHRRSGDDADDGRRVVCLPNVTLGDAEWVEDYFPFAVMRWSEDPMFYFGTGLAYELAGIQAEINTLLLEIQRAHRLVKGHWAVQQGSKVNLRHINDDLMAIVQYSGVEPRYYTPVAVAPDVYQHLWNLYEKAYEISGVNQLSATSAKPAGLDSGEAIRTFDDIQTERFMEVGTMLEDWTMEVTEQTVDRCRDISKAHGFKVNARSKDMIEQIDFKDVDLPKDSYIIQVFPTSQLPSTPAGRKQWVLDMTNSNNPLMSPEDAFELLGFPDTDEFAKRRNARRKVIERNAEKVILDGEWVSPEPFDLHEYAVPYFNDMLAVARLDGVPDKNLDLGRRYIALTVKLQAQANPPPPPPPDPGMLPPGAPPGAMPPPDMGAANGAPPPPPMAA